jgi:undecaprenyl-diphosphatase
MNYLQIAVLALIQGAAELLPVSSSAHVIVAQRLMGLNPSAPEQVFMLVMLHTGTMFAVLYYFWPRWRKLLAQAPGSDRLHFPKMVILATVVTGVVGLGMKFLIENIILVRILGESKGEVEQLFKNLPLIATALFAVGLLIIAAGRWEAAAKSDVLTPRASMWIGVIQGLCLPFRGFSRSGATISTALGLGVSRSLAEDFSFALAVVLTPAVIALSVIKLIDKTQAASVDYGALFLPGLVGMVFSFASGLAALHFLSSALENGRWRYFGYYCLVAAIVVASAGVVLGPVPEADRITHQAPPPPPAPPSP